MTDLLDPTAQELALPATRIYDTAPARAVRSAPTGPAGGPHRSPRRRPARGHLALQVGVILILWMLLFIVLGFLVSLNPPARPHVVPQDREPVTVTTPRAVAAASYGTTVPSRVDATPRAPAGGTAPQSVAGTRPPVGPTTGEDRDTAGADVPVVSRPSTTSPGSVATQPPPASPAVTAPPETAPPSATPQETIPREIPTTTTTEPGVEP